MPKMKFDYGNVFGVLILAVLVIGGSFYIYKNYLIPKETIPISESEIYIGGINFKISQTDSLAGGTHAPTNPVYYFYHSEPTSWGTGISITASGTVIEVTKEDKGYCWMALYCGDDEYFDLNKILSANSRIKQWYYKDLDGDDVSELVLKLWVGNVGVTGQGVDPSFTLALPMIDEDVAGWTDDNPDDKSAIGTTAGTEITVTWKFEGISLYDGGVIAQIYFMTNSTLKGDDIKLDEVRIFGDTTIDTRNLPSSTLHPVKEVSGNYGAYFFSPDDYEDPYHGILVSRPEGANDATYISLKMKLYFDSGSSAEWITVDIYVDVVGSDGAISTLNDQVILKS